MTQIFLIYLKIFVINLITIVPLILIYFYFSKSSTLLVFILLYINILRHQVHNAKLYFYQFHQSADSFVSSLIKTFILFIIHKS